MIKVVAVDQIGYSKFYMSDDVFALKNEVPDTTTTTETETETRTTPQISPGWSYLIGLTATILIIGLKGRKRK